MINEDLDSLFNDENHDIEIETQKWLKNVNKIISSSFSKIRIKKEKIAPELENLFSQRENLMQEIAKCENDDLIEKELDLREKLEEISNKIADACADKNKKIIDEYIGDIDLSSDGFNQLQTWGLKKKLAPRNTIDPPAAKKNDSGQLVTEKQSLENLYLETYRKRLASNPVPEDLSDLVKLKEYLFEIRKKIAQNEVSREWNIQELEKEPEK